MMKTRQYLHIHGVEYIVKTFLLTNDIKGQRQYLVDRPKTKTTLHKTKGTTLYAESYKESNTEP